MFKTISITALLCCNLPLLLFSQASDTLYLPLVEINADRFDVADFRRPSFVKRINPVDHPNRSGAFAGDILRSDHRFLVRSYGPGSAQTSGSQGFSSSQIKVMWNGMEINHTMLGQTDLSLIPAVLLDEVVVNSNQGSSEYGAYALGGVVLLNSTYSSDETAKAGFQASSDGSIATHGSVSTQVSNWRIKAGISHQRQENNYKFNDVTQNPAVTRRRTNAEKEIFSGLISSRYQNRNHESITSVWYTDSDSQIPGPIVAPSTIAYQIDEVLRLVHTTNIVWNDRVTIGLKANYGTHRLDFIDENSNINSLSRSSVAGTELNLKYRSVSNAQYRFRLGTDYSWVDTSEYDADPVLHNYVQINGLYDLFGKVYVYPSLRFDIYDQFDNAFTYGIGLNYLLVGETVVLATNFNRNYAPPTFNGLYWPDLGNPDLTPEKSNKFSGGVRFTLKTSILSVEYFNSIIDNGILWSPDQNGRFRPNNVNSLLNSGFSSDVSTQQSFGKVDVLVHGGWTYSSASFNDSRFQGDGNKGKQVAYQPDHKVVSGIRLYYSGARFNFHHEYIGRRFTNDSNTIKLDPFYKIDAAVDYTFRITKTHISIGAAVLNMTDTEYEQIRWYPMPGRMYQISINIKH